MDLAELGEEEEDEETVEESKQNLLSLEKEVDELRIMTLMDNPNDSGKALCEFLNELRIVCPEGAVF